MNRTAKGRNSHRWAPTVQKSMKPRFQAIYSSVCNAIERCAPCFFIFGIAVAAAQPSADSTRKIFVEPFAAGDSATSLHDSASSALTKAGITVVHDLSQADFSLGAGGDIYVREYRSLNPRSGRRPENGTPVYAGYLSVELKDRAGVTVWSYLAIPPSDSATAARDLARGIARKVADALPKLRPLPTAIPNAPITASLRGSGATFPFPVYSKWIANYRREVPSVNISYNPVGSEAGIRALLRGDIDFGASDAPAIVHELAASAENDFRMIPSVIGAVVPVVNLPGVHGVVSFTPQVLAGIFLGTIKKWNDPLLLAANPHLGLPDREIEVIHRSDGSGTSYVWTEYLASVSPKWKSAVGASFAPEWPVGRAANGNDGVAQAVKEFGGSIGYVEYAYAFQNHLSYGRIRNRAGQFVQASIESIGAAVSHAESAPGSARTSILNVAGAGAYPVSSFTWLVIPTHIADAAKRDAVASFLRWILGPGQRQAAALGYVALPADLAQRELEELDKIR